MLVILEIIIIPMCCNYKLKDNGDDASDDDADDDDDDDDTDDDD